MTMPEMPQMSDEERERVRGYLIAQAAKLPLPDLVAKVRADTQPLRAVAASVPADRFAERPGAEDWSAAEVFSHILQMTKDGSRAIESILDTGVGPREIVDEIYDDGALDPRTAAEYWDAYNDRREALFRRVLQARGDEYPDVIIRHPLFGGLSWRQWFLFMRVHDLDHMRQIQSVADTLRAG